MVEKDNLLIALLGCCHLCCPALGRAVGIEVTAYYGSGEEVIEGDIDGVGGN